MTAHICELNSNSRNRFIFNRISTSAISCLCEIVGWFYTKKQDFRAKEWDGKGGGRWKIVYKPCQHVAYASEAVAVGISSPALFSYSRLGRRVCCVSFSVTLCVYYSAHGEPCRYYRIYAQIGNNSDYYSVVSHDTCVYNDVVVLLRWLFVFSLRHMLNKQCEYVQSDVLLRHGKKNDFVYLRSRALKLWH